MDERKLIILNTIIKEHIKTGAPVGSGVLVDKYRLDISPATVRNEMAALEEEDFIIQPHTSAGRIPTEKAYNLYLSSLKEKQLAEKEAEILKRALKGNDEASFKQVAKEMAKISGNAIFWAFHKNNLYYTGISNLFSQPEFSEPNLIYNISAIIDRMDEIIDDIFNEVKETEILLGSANPFGDSCSTIFSKYRRSGKTGLFGILGPMRMDYEKNLALVKYVGSLIRG
jgi:transcriptional regulator of heat shock response